MGKSFSEIKKLAQKHLMNNVGRYDLSLEKGKGIYVWDSEGRKYHDFIAGIAVCALGHAPDIIAEVISSQAKKLIHISNLYYSELLVDTAAFLTEKIGYGRAFFCNSGVEANEAAIKLARKASYDKYGEGRQTIISALNSFHGRSLATIAASGQEKMRVGFGPDMPGFSYVDFGDIDDLAKNITSETCAVMLEPIQGESGVRIAPKNYLLQVAEICKKFDLNLIFDEIQTGLGRTGKAFAFQHYDGLKPNIISLAKALGGGFPLGAMVADEKTAQSFTPGTHSTTVGGAPLSMAVAKAMMGEILKLDFLANVTELGIYFLAKLNKLKDKHHHKITDVRGLGLLLGLELNININANEIRLLLQERGFLVNIAAGSVIRLAPALIIKKEEIDLFLDALDEVLKIA